MTERKWSEDPTENQILKIFASEYSFKILRELMKKPMTMAELANTLSHTNYVRIYAAINSLRKIGFVKIKEYKLTNEFTKTAVFTPTVKNIIIKISETTTVSTDTKLVLHDEGFESG